MNVFLLKRYLWLISTVSSRGPISLADIKSAWFNSGLTEADCETDTHRSPLSPNGRPKYYSESYSTRTFHRHRNDIQSIFGLHIDYDSSARGYVLRSGFNARNNHLVQWMMDSVAIESAIQNDSDIRSRILLEDIPSGRQFLMPIITAMRRSETGCIVYRKFKSASAETISIEPYHLRVKDRRWYLIARRVADGEMRIYGLDRIERFEAQSGQTFKIDKHFDIDRFFEGCCGMFSSPDMPIERILVRAYGLAADFIESLPIHSSQSVVSRNEGSTTFEFHVRPNLDFQQALLRHGAEIEVVSPAWVRQQMADIGRQLLARHQQQPKDTP